MKLNSDLVCAVVVTYCPELEKLGRLFQSVISQVGALVVVDNGSDERELSFIRNWFNDEKMLAFSLLELGENLGVAAAQNRGVAWAREYSCSHVLLFDQDSIPSTNMVQLLLQALGDLASSNRLVAAVGPKLVDLRTGRSTPFVEINCFGVKRIQCGEQLDHLIRTDFLVSSGTLVPMTVFDQVGLLEEGLFIDNVDMEWCFRARSMGFLLYGVCDAVMQHSIGDQAFKIGPRELYRHSPLRQYYIMRNRILLYRRKYSPVGWIVQDVARMMFKILMFSLVLPPRCENILMMFRGVRDACIGRFGRYRG